MVFKSIPSEAFLGMLLDSVCELDMTRGQFGYGLHYLANGSTASDILRSISDGFSYLFLHSKLPGGLSRVVSLGVFPCSQMVARGRII